MEQVTTTLGGHTLTLETGRLAKQANGAVLVTYGETMVLVTATASREPRPGVDFFPLTVDYEERLYAVGRIPGGFIKREGRATERAILADRLTDRPLRPLFPKGFRNDVQIVATVLSVDHDCPIEIAGMIGASAALHISDIPFDGPIAGCLMGMEEDRPIVGPTLAQQEEGQLHLVVAGSTDAVIMIEAGAKEVSEAKILEAILHGHDAMQPVIEVQEELRRKCGKEKRTFPTAAEPEALKEEVSSWLGGRLREALLTSDKLEREVALDRLRDECVAALAGAEDGDGPSASEVDRAYQANLKRTARQLVVREQIRPDGRRPDEIRPISVEVSGVPKVHGTGLFTRGQTQVMTLCTLGALSEAQILDGLGAEESKRYIHHYNFPPFSTGETKPLRGPSRRSIGHGYLAERALVPMIPPEDEFPYTIRLVSEVLESNGSTSMASVCGSTLALMDAGVPIKAPVAGVAMGLIKEGDDVVILTDIQGMEDALGDMDFKVAGTKDGITAIQMDIKIGGLSREILEQALAQAHDGRLFILGKMTAVIDAPRTTLSAQAPRMMVFKVHPDKIREVIGPGGKTINKIIEATRVGTKKVGIDIHDDGTIYISAVNEDAGAKALDMIKNLVREPEPGEIYTGKVTRIVNFGAFVEILPGKEGLLHISQLAEHRVEKVEDVVKVGDEVLVKVVEIDHLGRVNLSHKAAVREQEAQKG